MRKEKSIFNFENHSVSRVPAKDRVNVLTMCIVRIGATTSLVQFMLGSTLGHSMTFHEAMLATILGSSFLEFISLGLGVAGAKEGLSTSLLSRWCGFGYLGSAIVGCMIAVSSLGWFGVQNSIVAEGVVAVLGMSKFSSVFYIAAAVSGLSISVLVAFGLRGLGWIAKAALPLFFLVIGWIFYQILKSHELYYLFTMKPSGTSLSLSEAATAVAGGYIVFAIISPDMSRYCRSGKHVFWMMTSSIVIGEIVVNGISILVAHAMDTSDVVAIMMQSAGWLGLFSLLLSAVKINDLNLYSAVLGFSNLLFVVTGRSWSYAKLALTLGIFGTIVSVMGILEKFIHFLITLGVLFPPVAGIMLVDYYILRTHRVLLDTTREQEELPDAQSTPKIGMVAIVSWIGGSMVGFTVEWGISSINSLLAASLLYWSIGILNKKYRFSAVYDELS